MFKRKLYFFLYSNRRRKHGRIYANDATLFGYKRRV